jgi:imidazolonepropionase-like amidohydrolase
MTMSQEQLDAACDEAKKQGLRTLAHAFRDAVRAAIHAGCTEVEHGLGASDDDLRLMAEQGAYLDPQAGLLLETYLQNKDRYLASPYYTVEGFAAMKGLIVAPGIHETSSARSRVENCLWHRRRGGRLRSQRGGFY